MSAEAAYKVVCNLKSDLGDLLLGQVSPALKSKMINDPEESVRRPDDGLNGHIFVVGGCD